jgi:hypothetical protein
MTLAIASRNLRSRLMMTSLRTGAELAVFCLRRIHSVSRASSQRSASIAAMHPVPAAVTA